MTERKHDTYIQRARDVWTGNDLEIDDHPDVREAEHGCWVAAWVWISDYAVTEEDG